MNHTGRGKVIEYGETRAHAAMWLLTVDNVREWGEEANREIDPDHPPLLSPPDRHRGCCCNLEQAAIDDEGRSEHTVRDGPVEPCDCT